jgi:NADH-quinone oxidoreductase subunit F
MDYESVATVGSQLGSASVIVVDDTINMAWLVEKTVNFFKHESCGKCTPCREGTYWMNHLARRISAGQADLEDIDMLQTVANQITGKCLCALGEFSTMTVTTGIRQFREDFDASVRKPAEKPEPQPQLHPAAEADRAEVGR